MSNKPTYEELELKIKELEREHELREKAENELLESQNRYREMFQNSLVGLLRTRVDDGKALEANDRIASMLGYANRTEFIRDFYSPNAYVNIEDRNYVLNVLKTHGEIKDYVIHAIRKDGVKIWVKYSAKLSPSKNYIDVVVIDITNEKEAELERESIYKRLLETQKEELKDTQSQYRDIFHNSLVGLSRTRVSDGKLLEANDRLASMFGYENREQMLSEFYATSAYTRQEDRQYMVDTIKRDGQIKDYEVFAKRRDGTNLWVKYSAKLYPDKGYLDVVVIDITREKEVEKEKERLYAQLIQSQKMEAIGRLAGGIAHDFKNMLTTIKSMTQFALKLVDEKHPLHKPLSLTLSASESATNITQQLLIFGRRTPMRLQPMDVNTAIKRLLGILKAVIPENVKVVTKFDKAETTVQGDESKIEQVLMNLIINARDAMPDGGTLTVSTGMVSKNDIDPQNGPHTAESFVAVTIEDTGMGMAKEIVEKIYEPFFSNKAGHGIGLGMAIVYSVVKEHGGEIRIESIPNKGTTVKLYLPATSKKAVIEKKRPARKAAAGKNERILVVEDDPLLRESVGMILSSNGYLVFSANNAEEALKLIGDGGSRFHLILSDVVLPGISGIQLVQELKNRKIGIPVVLCSGYAEQKLKWSKSEDTGCRFIEKPYDINRLLQMIRDSLN